MATEQPTAATEQSAAPLPHPTAGGSWIRNPDGSLSREPGTEATPQRDAASMQTTEE